MLVNAEVQTGVQASFGVGAECAGGMMHFDSCSKAGTTQRFCALEETIATVRKSLDMYSKAP